MGALLSVDILQYAREHEEAIKQAAVERMSRYYAETPIEMMEEKFVKGREKYGPFNPHHDWISEAELEFQDAFWYEAMYRRYEEN